MLVFAKRGPLLHTATLSTFHIYVWTKHNHQSIFRVERQETNMKTKKRNCCCVKHKHVLKLFSLRTGILHAPAHYKMLYIPSKRAYTQQGTITSAHQYARLNWRKCSCYVSTCILYQSQANTKHVIPKTRTWTCLLLQKGDLRCIQLPVNLPKLCVNKAQS